MDIIELDRKRLQDVKGLWEELNSHHGRLSSNFKEHFDSFTFEDRIKKLTDSAHLSIFVATHDGSYIGYCIVTADKDKGEIDSIYIQPTYQGQGIGERLMQKALDWFNERECSELMIYVAEGNESVLEFYEKFGFRKRFVVLQR